MDTINYSDFRNHLAKHMDLINKNHKPLLVTRQNSKSIVVMSLEYFESFDETAYLIASAKNAKRLSQSVEEISQIKLNKRS